MTSIATYLESSSTYLAKLLKPSDTHPARVQFWLNANVTATDPTLLGNIQRFSKQFADQFVVASTPQTVPVVKS